jgi:Ras GTPase-activating-like protein IQGAP2/3
LAKKGIAPKIKNLVGQLEFTDAELAHTEKSLADAGVQLPQFGNIEGALAKELNEETDEQKREKYLAEHEKEIIKTQASIRSHLASKKYKAKLELFKQNEPFVIKLQSQIRSFLAQKAHKEKLAFYKQSEGFAIKLQAHARGFLNRKAFNAQTLV